MKKECERKYKAYPRFLRKFTGLMKKYEKLEITKCIRENCEFIFRTWFSKMFAFDSNRIRIIDPIQDSYERFAATFQYVLNSDEILQIGKMMKGSQYALLTRLNEKTFFIQIIGKALNILGRIVESHVGYEFSIKPVEVIQNAATDGMIVELRFIGGELG
nr:hypothetical protein [Candidatus Sigynarchaeota archaeon]